MWRFPTISPQLSDSLTLETNFLLRLMKKSFASGCWQKSYDSYEKLRFSAAKSWLKQDGIIGIFLIPMAFQSLHTQGLPTMFSIEGVKDGSFGVTTGLGAGFIPGWNFQRNHPDVFETINQLNCQPVHGYLDESRWNPITIDTNLRYQPTINHTGT